MTDAGTIKWGWLRLMYAYTVVGAGGVGIGMLAFPDWMNRTFGWPAQDPVVFGIAGSVFVAFALVSALGLRSPLKFLPILLLQLCYKTVWFVGLVLPLWLSGQFPAYGLLYVAIFASYIIGDLVALPFGYLLAREQTS